jgi:mercuric ion transport protein
MRMTAWANDARDGAIATLAPAPSSRSAPVLWLAALAALLASSCCLLPLAFVLVGISGAWIAQLTLLQPYSPYLEALAALALGVAGWRIYRPASCRSATPMARAGFWLVALLTSLPIAVALLAPGFY